MCTGVGSGSPSDWHQYDFHLHVDPVSLPLVLNRKHQLDAFRANWEGLVAGTDGSVDDHSERMGEGTLLVISAPVGGPLTSI